VQILSVIVDVVHQEITTSKRVRRKNAPGKIVSACQVSLGIRIGALLNVASIMDRNIGIDSLMDEEFICQTAPV